MNTKPQTPMLQQYLSIKQEYPDAILFFRLGDFYEMFFEDAVTASEILEITLTSRNKGESEPVPLCGVPYHACDQYLAKLITAGRKVAICEQTEDPKTAKGVVKREVVRVVTPGMVMEDSVLEGNKPNFLTALHSGKTFSFSTLDISTGCFRCGSLETFETLADEVLKLEPKELILPKSWEGTDLYQKVKQHFPNALITTLTEKEFNPSLVETFPGKETVAAEMPEALKAAGALWSYACYTQKGKPSHVTKLCLHRAHQFLILDEAAQKNLELLKTQEQEQQGSLLRFLDGTHTSMGSRKLREMLLYPLVDLEAIHARQEAIRDLTEQFPLQQLLENCLGEVADLERLTAKTATGSCNARDLRAIGLSLAGFPKLSKGLQEAKGLLREPVSFLEGFEVLSERILKTLREDLPLTVKEGGLIQSGVDDFLDELHGIAGSGKKFIARMEAKERERTGISSLKIKFNRIFGYYIEVTHTHKEKVPDDYMRKQTLVNAERYITPELKSYEEKVLGAEEKIKRMEYEIFLKTREEAARYGEKIQKAAAQIALLDALFSLSKIAAKHRWTIPEVHARDVLIIEEGRHPIVEQLTAEPFVPNDIYLDNEENRFLMITGPNMAGKSTVMRQTALIVILAQMGSFVPAAEASIGLVDRIFTRVGANDRLTRGESTFMVEMNEAAHILREATAKSLVLIDEIGRGTSTYDGVAIAWAVAEYLNNKIGAKTLFATHYHELIELPQKSKGMRNFNIAVKEWNDRIIFLRKLVPGGTSRSYGVEVAKLAGLPEEVIMRAREILAKWEAFSESKEERQTDQLSLFQSKRAEKTQKQQSILSELKEIDLNRLTPMQAFDFLVYLQGKLS